MASQTPSEYSVGGSQKMEIEKPVSKVVQARKEAAQAARDKLKTPQKAVKKLKPTKAGRSNQTSVRETSPIPEEPENGIVPDEEDGHFQTLKHAINRTFTKKEDVEFMFTYLNNLARVECSFCGGIGHLPHVCTSKKHVDNLMRETNNAASWGRVKNKEKQRKYTAMREAKRLYLTRRFVREEEEE